MVKMLTQKQQAAVPALNWRVDVALDTNGNSVGYVSEGYSIAGWRAVVSERYIATVGNRSEAKRIVELVYWCQSH